MPRHLFLIAFALLLIAVFFSQCWTKQHLFLCTEYQKKSLLKKILQEFNGYKVIVFANTKAKCSDLHAMADYGTSMGKSNYIHGDVDQSQRTRLVKGNFPFFSLI